MALAGIKLVFGNLVPNLPLGNVISSEAPASPLLKKEAAMKKALLGLTLMLATVVCVSSCGKQEEPPKPKEVTPQQLKEQAGKLMQTTKDYLQQQKEKYLQDFNGRLQALDKKIDNLKAEADKATPEMKQKIQAVIDQLQEKQQVIKKQLAESKDAAGKAWDDLKTNLDETLKQMNQDLEKEKKM
jgi:DNA anti-recombination protein RmuC